MSLFASRSLRVAAHLTNITHFHCIEHHALTYRNYGMHYIHTHNALLWKQGERAVEVTVVTRLKRKRVIATKREPVLRGEREVAVGDVELLFVCICDHGIVFAFGIAVIMNVPVVVCMCQWLCECASGCVY